MSRGACIKCGFPPVLGHRYCAQCAERLTANPRETFIYEPVPVPCSEELCATCMGRMARIEDDIRHLLDRMTGHDAQLVELLREAAKEKPA